MPNISHYNVSDVALYFQALVGWRSRRWRAQSQPKRFEGGPSPISKGVARSSLCRRYEDNSTRWVRKSLFDLRQMGLATVADGKVKLTAAGFAIVDSLKKGEGRRGRLAILGRLIETYDNAAFLCATLTPPMGKPLFVPIPRATRQRRR